MTTNTLLSRLRHGLALAVIGAALLVPAAAANVGGTYGSHDPWYDYAVSLAETTHTPGFVPRAFVPTGGPRAVGTISPSRLHGLIVDTLAPGGARSTQPQGYRFTTDTLAPGGGGAVDAVASGTPFSWADASIGAGTAVGALLVLAGSAVLTRRRTRVAT